MVMDQWVLTSSVQQLRSGFYSPLFLLVSVDVWTSLCRIRDTVSVFTTNLSLYKNELMYHSCYSTKLCRYKLHNWPFDSQFLAACCSGDVIHTCSTAALTISWLTFLPLCMKYLLSDSECSLALRCLKRQIWPEMDESWRVDVFHLCCIINCIAFCLICVKHKMLQRAVRSLYAVE